MNESNIIKMFLSDIKCGNCGKHCEPESFNVLEHKEDRWLFSIQCSSCNCQGFIVVNVKKSEEPEVVTEPTEDEKDRFSTAVASSDVLDMYLFLKDFSGDFSSLLSCE